MSDYTDTKLEHLDLLPNQISIDPRYNVRPFECHATGEAQQQSNEDIERLAHNIEAIGQLDAIQITRERVLVCGHRRRKAVILINGWRSAIGKPLLKIHCTIDPTPSDLVIKAFSSNHQRANLSPVDLAYFLHQFRQERGFLDRKGAIQTARLLNISRHIVDISEQLMRSSKEIQNKLHDGAIAANTALLLMKQSLPAGELTKLFDRSREIQLEDQTARIIEDVNLNGKPHAVAARELTKAVAAKRIEKPAIVQALREYQTNGKAMQHPSKIIPLTYTGFLKGLAMADNPSQCRQARKLIRYLLKDYASGASSQKELERQFSIACEDGHAAGVTPIQIATTYN